MTKRRLAKKPTRAKARRGSPHSPHEHPKLVRYDIVGIDEADLARVARALLAVAGKRRKRRP